MSQVSITATAGDCIALHANTKVALLDDVHRRYRLPKTRPAGVGIKLGLGVIQCGVATDAAIQPWGAIAVVYLAVVFPAECHFSSRLARHAVRERGQLSAPF